MIDYSANPPKQHTLGISAIYVDTENLTPPSGADEVSFAQELITRIVADWPDKYPPIGLLALYVPADKTSQWRTWASAQLLERHLLDPTACLEPTSWRVPISTEGQDQLRVRGVQHFSRNGSKNSADLAIVLDIMDDLLIAQRADFVAVLSNDSDFYALFDKLYEIVTDRGHPVSKVPLLWIVAPNGNNLSPEIKRFLLPQFIWDLSAEFDDGNFALENQHQKEFSGELLATLVDSMQKNKQYRASELHDLFKSKHREHSLASENTASFGSLLKNSAPRLSDLGVEVTSTSGTSRYTRK